MSALTAGMQGLYALLQGALGNDAVYRHPDDATPFEPDVEAAVAAGKVLVRYYQPQLLGTGGMAPVLCTVDIVARTSAEAATATDRILTAIGSNARTPSGAIQPRAAAFREPSYHRVNLQFTLLVDTIPA